MMTMTTIMIILMMMMMMMMMIYSISSAPFICNIYIQIVIILIRYILEPRGIPLRKRFFKKKK